MPTIHEDIEPWLAASVHDQLSPHERTQLQEHLATCAACRALHEQEIAMNTMIQSTLEETKPDLAFEQRVVSGFRKTAPQRSGLTPFLANLLRFRTTQIAAVADESGLFATVRRTLGQGAAALMWSLRMIGVALAFFAPWVLAIAAVVWIVRRIARARKARRNSAG